MGVALSKHRASGCLFGLALGDALGAVTEFLSVDEILQQFPPHSPQSPLGNPAQVTDDTQMSLAVGEALVEAARPLTAASLEPPLRRAFVEWWHSPDNNRAPGLTGGSPLGLVARLRDYAQSQREVYHASWLGSLWVQSFANTPEAFIARGWDECLEVLDRVEAALVASDRDTDPCIATGEGWIAEEAFATGLLCFLLYPEEPVQALRRAAVTRGDSDSIACLCGAFAGAYHGISAWSADWLLRIEYRDRLSALGNWWDED